jgi:hypothetical protein
LTARRERDASEVVVTVNRVIVVAAAIVVGLTGCGTGGPAEPGVASVGGSGQPSTTPSLSDQQKAVRYAQCLRDHGLTVADPPAGSTNVDLSGVSKQAAAAAIEACKQYAPGGILGGPPDPATLAQLRQFAACMRARGVAVTDPDPVTGVITLQPGPGTNKTDPKTSQASAECEHLLPAAASPGSGGGT